MRRRERDLPEEVYNFLFEDKPFYEVVKEAGIKPNLNKNEISLPFNVAVESLGRWH